MNVAIVMPQSERHRLRPGPLGWSKTLGYEPPGLSLLATLAARALPEGSTVRVIDEMTERFDPHTLEADLVGLTVITPTAGRAYGFADLLRSRGVRVVLGGRHVTLCPDEAQRHADSIVVGRGERAWPELLRDVLAGRLRRRYSGSGEGFGHAVADRRFTSRDYITKNTVQSSIGCPYGCTFCVVPRTQDGYLRADPRTLLGEIEGFSGKTFLDLSLSPMERLGDGFLTGYLRGLAHLKRRWGGLSTARALGNKALFDLLIKSGLKGVLIGLESLSAASLRGFGKGFSKPGEYLELIRKLHDHGVVVNGCFIFGADDDRPDVFERTVAFAFEAGLDLPRYAVLTPFPGTPLFAQLRREGRLLHTDWSRYDTQHVVYRPKNMSVGELEAGLRYAWRETYSLGGVARRVLKSASSGTLSLLPVSVASNLGYVGYTRFPGGVPQPCERPQGVGGA